MKRDILFLDELRRLEYLRALPPRGQDVEIERLKHWLNHNKNLVSFTVRKKYDRVMA